MTYLIAFGWKLYAYFDLVSREVSFLYIVLKENPDMRFLVCLHTSAILYFGFDLFGIGHCRIYGLE